MVWRKTDPLKGKVFRIYNFIIFHYISCLFQIPTITNGLAMFSFYRPCIVFLQTLYC